MPWTAACQPVLALPAPENQIVVGLQLKNPQVLWEPCRACHRAPTSLTAWQQQQHSYARNAYKLHTNQAFPSSMAWVLSCGIWVLISASLSAEMEGKGVGFVILGRETSPASTDQNFVVLHPSPLGREPQPPASSRTVKLLQGKSS